MLEEGLACGLHRIERLMRLNALRARPRRRGKPKDDGERSVIADNILDRDFQADRPNQKWLADFTYIWTAEGWLYVAVVLDLFSRRAVGWSMKAERDASLVMDALMMAVWRRGKADALPHHSDQGSQYTSEQFQRLLADNGITCSMSRAGKVSDNSAMESFFSKRAMAHGGRSGYVGCGIFFSPAIALVPAMLAFRADQDERAARHRLLCNMRSVHKGHCKSALMALAALDAL